MRNAHQDSERGRPSDARKQDGTPAERGPGDLQPHRRSAAGASAGARAAVTALAAMIIATAVTVATTGCVELYRECSRDEDCAALATKEPHQCAFEQCVPARLLACDRDDGCGGNACGGTTPLTAAVGDPCGPCGDGTWHCASLDALGCSGAREVDACGGCSRSGARIGEPCGVSGAWWCDGQALVCGDDYPVRCFNGILDAGEDAVDCGGPCPRCPALIAARSDTAVALRGRPWRYEVPRAWSEGVVDATLLSGPAGVTVEPGGILRWAPTSRELGRHVATVRLAAGAGQDRVAIDVVVTIDVREERVTQVATHSLHSCALLESGAVRCWGLGANALPQSDGPAVPLAALLGYGGPAVHGADTPAGAGGDVPLGGAARSLCVGGLHACAALEDGTVRCWGSNSHGQLGRAGGEDIGDDEPVDAVEPLRFAEPIAQVVCGTRHSCARSELGSVWCWGADSAPPCGGGISCWWGSVGAGILGAGLADGGDSSEGPADSTAALTLGGPARSLCAGPSQTCAVVDDGALVCWGANVDGELGLGHREPVGDDEPPHPTGRVDVPFPVADVHCAEWLTCIRSRDGAMVCWGNRENRVLAWPWAPTELWSWSPRSLPLVQVGMVADLVGVGPRHACAALRTRMVCWGGSWHGMDWPGVIGDEEHPEVVPRVDIVPAPAAIVGGARHTFAVLGSGELRGWGAPMMPAILGAGPHPPERAADAATIRVTRFTPTVLDAPPALPAGATTRWRPSFADDGDVITLSLVAAPAWATLELGELGHGELVFVTPVDATTGTLTLDATDGATVERATFTLVVVP